MVPERFTSPLGLEVAHEVGVRQRIVAIAEVAVNEQAVVEQLAGQHALELHVRPPAFAGAEIGAHVPVVVVDDVGKRVAQLAGQGGGKDTWT